MSSKSINLFLFKNCKSNQFIPSFCLLFLLERKLSSQPTIFSLRKCIYKTEITQAAFIFLRESTASKLFFVGELNLPLCSDLWLRSICNSISKSHLKRAGSK
ncbi:hypothetical protein NQD34_005375 [Periophthalmus magnuspinnatus]|nr:hypothetical protein NQD34_005375 [Periophthalmus magnuspinnatus]